MAEYEFIFKWIQFEAEADASQMVTREYCPVRFKWYWIYVQGGRRTMRFCVYNRSHIKIVIDSLRLVNVTPCEYVFMIAHERADLSRLYPMVKDKFQRVIASRKSKTRMARENWMKGNVGRIILMNYGRRFNVYPDRTEFVTRTNLFEGAEEAKELLRHYLRMKDALWECRIDKEKRIDFGIPVAAWTKGAIERSRAAEAEAGTGPLWSWYL